MQRPLSVTASGWFLIINAALSVPAMLWALSSPAAREMIAIIGRSPAHMLISSLSPLGMMAAGWGMLEGRTWARNLFLGLLLFSLFWGSFQLGAVAEGMWLWSLVVNMPSVAIAVAVTRPRAGAYFRGDPDPEPGLVRGLMRLRRSQQRGHLSRVTGILLMTVGGVVGAMMAFGMSAVSWMLGASGGRSLTDLLGPTGTMLLAVSLSLAVSAFMAGVLLWGWRRWQVTVGTALAALGAYFTATFLYAPYMIDGPWLVGVKSGNRAFRSESLDMLRQAASAGQSLAWFTAALAFLGLLMACHRWRNDREKVRAALAQ